MLTEVYNVWGGANVITEDTGEILLMAGEVILEKWSEFILCNTFFNNNVY